MEISSISLVWEPSSSETDKFLQGSCELTALNLAASGSSAYVAIYDSKDLAGCTPNSKRWVLDASTTVNDSMSFASPLIFKKGVYAVCEQGYNFNPKLCLAAHSYVN